MKILILSCAILAIAASSYAKDYSKYKVYQVNPKSLEELNFLKSFEKLTKDVDFWNEARAINHSIDIMISPKFQRSFIFALKAKNIEYTELINDVGKVFQADRLQRILIPKPPKGRISFDNYHRYDVISEYLESLAADYDFVTLHKPATSSEKRPVYLLKIATGGNNKPAIFVDGGIHAREWIAPAVSLYVINQLIENPNNANMIEETDWYIVPVLNPDGYEYTHTTERLWRKTRSKGEQCDGVDGNRNFDFHWLETGASGYECHENYAGPVPLSEPEMAAVTDTILENKEQIKLYLTFHSYGQYLLYPWGFTSELPEDWPELDALAVEVEKAISAVDGTRYEIGSSTNVLYAAAGGSDDWAKGVGGVQLSYTIELPGGGLTGFDPLPQRIDPIVKETWEGVKVYQAYVQDKFGRK